MSKTAAKQKRIREKQAKDIQAQLPSRNWRLELALIAIIVLLAFGARYIGLMDAGITYDEPNYILSGNLFVSNWAHLDFSESAWSAIYEHPPVSRYIYGTAISLLGTPLFNYNAFINAKLASALMGALTCVIVYLLGRDFFGRKVGITSALILSFIPVFMAHTQIAALESPLVLFFTLTVYLFMVALQRDSRGYFLASAVPFGLTLGTKFNGILLLPLLALIFTFFTLQKAEGSGLKAKADNVVRNIGRYVPVDRARIFRRYRRCRLLPDLAMDMGEPDRPSAVSRSATGRPPRRNISSGPCRAPRSTITRSTSRSPRRCCCSSHGHRRRRDRPVEGRLQDRHPGMAGSAVPVRVQLVRPGRHAVPDHDLSRHRAHLRLRALELPLAGSATASRA